MNRNPTPKPPVKSLKYPVRGGPIKAPIYPIEMIVPAARPTFPRSTSSTGRVRRRAKVPPNVIPKMGETNQLNDGLIDTMAEQMEINEKLKIIMSLLLPILSHSMGTKRTAGISTKDMTEVTIAAKVEVQPRSAKYVGSHPIVQ
jgi:hypothetical protein